MKENIAAKHLTSRIAEFAKLSAFSQLDTTIVAQLKKHLLDATASMIYASRQDTILKCFHQHKALQENGSCLVPLLGTTGADRAAQWYTQLTRYPDFMDNYLAKDATCHPSDNIGSLLAAAQITGASGRDVLIAMAVAYQLQCRLVNDMPVMLKGIDHTMLLACSVTAATGKLFSLNTEQLAHALGIAACTFNASVGSRQSYTYEWKGLASSLVAGSCMQILLMAKEGITGPVNYFEGFCRFEELTGMKPAFNQEKDDFSLISKCVLKSYNAEVHTQSAIEAMLMLRQQYNILPGEIKSIDLTTFATAYHITGGGKYGPRTRVQTKEQADHSLPYILAVALIDGQVMPEQFTPERIRRPDVQELLDKVKVHTMLPVKTPHKLMDMLDPYTQEYPDRLPAKVSISLESGAVHEQKCDDYKGFFTRPLTWNDVEEKFRRLSEGIIHTALQDEIIEVIDGYDKQNAAALTALLARI